MSRLRQTETKKQTYSTISDVGKCCEEKLKESKDRNHGVS